jgi:hypothetical protein
MASASKRLASGFARLSYGWTSNWRTVRMAQVGPPILLRLDHHVVSDPEINFHDSRVHLR